MRYWPVDGHKWLITDFKNDDQKKEVIPCIWTENASVQIENCVADLTDGSYRFGLFSMATPVILD